MGRMRTPPQSTAHGSIWDRLRRKSRSLPTPKAGPEIWQCIVHLKLLRAFARLEQDVIEGLDRPPTVDDNGKPMDGARAWQTYLEQAALRFEAWWFSLVPKDDNGNPVRTDCAVYERPGELEGMIRDTKAMVWTEKNVPPLDVVMTLHSFMLNPRCFLEDCIRFQMLPLWKAGMPWRILDGVLDLSKNEYVVPDAARRSWEKSTGCPWDVRKSSLTRHYPCPACGAALTVSSSGPDLSSDEKALSATTVQCKQCSTTFAEQHLHAHKLRRFIEDLYQRNTPVPGTWLASNGQARSRSGDNNAPAPFDLNTLLKSDIGQQILNLTDPTQMKTPTKPTLQDLTSLISTATTITPPTNPSLPLTQALHRLTLQTNDSLSPFSLSLPSAATRQTVFTHTMESLDWLHSPSLATTIHTLTSRYHTFVHIMDQYPTHVAVPTHAVDLAWHTHQLSPSSYYAFCLGGASGVFIDHDDRIAEGVRTDAFAWTAQRYKAITGREYGACLCWYCVTAREVAAEIGVEIPTGDGEGGHVAVSPGSGLDVEVRGLVAQGQFERLEEEFGVAVARARRRGVEGPGRRAFLKGFEGRWLYPGAVPVVDW